MADVVDKKTRSRMMSGIRAKDTQPELYLRKSLHAQGFRFRIHVKDIPGKPDIVLPKYRALIVIHGCFWHGHDCHYFKLPATNTNFWKTKIDSNRKRDRMALSRQHRDGWRCLVIWECAIRMSQRHPEKLNVTALAAQWLTGRCSSAVIDEMGLEKLSNNWLLDVRNEGE